MTKAQLTRALERERKERLATEKKVSVLEKENSVLRGRAEIEDTLWN